MRLDLEADVELIAELDDAGIVLKDADAPVVLAEAIANLLRGAEDRLFEQILVAFVAEIDDALERLVRAMLLPGLRDRLKLDVGRLTFERPEMGLDRFHLVERER